MSVRVTKYLGAVGSIASDAVRVIAPPIPVFPGEALRYLYVDCYAAARSSDAIDQPSEVNWALFGVPFHMLMTLADDNWTTPPAFPSNTAAWDSVMQRLLRTMTSDANIPYGGEIGAGQQQGFVAAPSETADTGAGEVGEEAGRALSGQDLSGILRRGTMDPIGFMRLWSREVIMRPVIAEAVDTVRFGDEWTIDQSYQFGAQQETAYIVPVCHRYEHAVESTYGVTMATSGPAAAAHNILNLGDMQRVRAIIKDDAGDLGNAMRTILFGGDTRIERDTLKGSSLKATLKIVCSIETPYSLDIA